MGQNQLVKAKPSSSQAYNYKVADVAIEEETEVDKEAAKLRADRVAVRRKLSQGTKRTGQKLNLGKIDRKIRLRRLVSGGKVKAFRFT